eukprot:COSAG01_NODE_8452_length_2781_cov_3.000000_2_plen_90_part_00
MRLFCDHARLRAARISNSVQRLFLRCDKLFRARAENVGKLRQTLAEHMVVRALRWPRTQRHGGITLLLTVERMRDGPGAACLAAAHRRD